MSIYKQREADSKSYGFSTPSFSVPRHKPMFIPNRSLDGIMFGKVPIQHRGTMPSKLAPIRRKESPKGASPNSRRRGGLARRTYGTRVHSRASPTGANIGLNVEHRPRARIPYNRGCFLPSLPSPRWIKCWIGTAYGEALPLLCLHLQSEGNQAFTPMGEGVKAKNTAYCRVYAREEEEEHPTRHEKRRRNESHKR